MPMPLDTQRAGEDKGGISGGGQGKGASAASTSQMNEYREDWVDATY